MAYLQAKRGDTFTITGTRTDSAGDPVDLTGTTITAQMRRYDTVINLTCDTLNAAGGTFTLSADEAVTALWSLGQYEVDVQFVEGLDTISTETFLVTILKDITLAS